MTDRGPRALRRRVDGVLLLDKPAGWSSNAALQRAKRLYAAEKAGHTGTLDPLASGLLPLCFGEATKFAQVLLDAPKGYVATLRFGTATDTGDAEGEIVAQMPVTFAREALDAVLPAFVGRILQVPPRHAALKYRGRNYYEYARAGVEIPRPAREVDVAAIELVDWAPPVAVLRVACGKGTYIRVLAEDIAAALGCCAHLTALRRTATGPFRIDDAVTLAELETMAPDERDARLLPADAPLVAMPRLDVGAGDALALQQGRAVVVSARESGRYRCYGPEGFVGVVEARDGAMRAARMLRSGAGAPSREAGHSLES